MVHSEGREAVEDLKAWRREKGRHGQCSGKLHRQHGVTPVNQVRNWELGFLTSFSMVGKTSSKPQPRRTWRKKDQRGSRFINMRGNTFVSTGQAQVHAK